MRQEPQATEQPSAWRGCGLSTLLRKAGQNNKQPANGSNKYSGKRETILSLAGLLPAPRHPVTPCNTLQHSATLRNALPAMTQILSTLRDKADNQPTTN
jgi:hypothetical protein